MLTRAGWRNAGRCPICGEPGKSKAAQRAKERQEVATEVRHGPCMDTNVRLDPVIEPGDVHSDKRVDLRRCDYDPSFCPNQCPLMNDEII